MEYVQNHKSLRETSGKTAEAPKDQGPNGLNVRLRSPRPLGVSRLPIIASFVEREKVWSCGSVAATTSAGRRRRRVLVG